MTLSYFNIGLRGVSEAFFDCVSLRSECFRRAVEGAGLAILILSGGIRDRGN